MDNRSPKVLRFSAWTLRVKRHNLFQVANKWTMSLFCEEYCQCCTAPCKQYCRQCCSAVNVYQCMFPPAPTRVNNRFWFVNALKGNYHELRMHLSEVVSGNITGFIRPLFVHGICFCFVLFYNLNSLPKETLTANKQSVLSFMGLLTTTIAMCPVSNIVHSTSTIN